MSLRTHSPRWSRLPNLGRCCRRSPRDCARVSRVSVNVGDTGEPKTLWTHKRNTMMPERLLRGKETERWAAKGETFDRSKHT